jgi:hypothetical protein
MERPGDVHRADGMRPDFPLPQIMTGDLDIAVVGQLPPPQFAFGDQFERGPVQVVGFQEARDCGLSGRQDLEHTPEHANTPS